MYPLTVNLVLKECEGKGPSGITSLTHIYNEVYFPLQLFEITALMT